MRHRRRTAAGHRRATALPPHHVRAARRLHGRDVHHRGGRHPCRRARRGPGRRSSGSFLPDGRTRSCSVDRRARRMPDGSCLRCSGRRDRGARRRRPTTGDRHPDGHAARRQRHATRRNGHATGPPFSLPRPPVVVTARPDARSHRRHATPRRRARAVLTTTRHVPHRHRHEQDARESPRVTPARARPRAPRAPPSRPTRSTAHGPARDRPRSVRAKDARRSPRAGAHPRPTRHATTCHHATGRGRSTRRLHPALRSRSRRLPARRADGPTALHRAATTPRNHRRDRRSHGRHGARLTHVTGRRIRHAATVGRRPSWWARRCSSVLPVVLSAHHVRIRRSRDARTWARRSTAGPPSLWRRPLGTRQL